MTPAETAKVLAACASFDQRTTGATDVAAWHAALGELTYEDARDAVVRHYKASMKRIMPLNVIEHATAIRAEREQREWEREHTHDFDGDENERCRVCTLPYANQRHRVPA